MREGIVFRILFFSLLLMILAACSQKITKQPGFVYHENVRSVEYYPLEKGNAWTYDVLEYIPGEQKGKKSSLVTQVVKREGEQASLISGAQTLVYRVSDAGIFKENSGTPLIPQPIVEGQSWPIESGDAHGRGRIESTNEKVITPAGFFEHCLWIIEEYPEADTAIHYFFVPWIGLARIEEYVYFEGERFLHLQVNLRIFRVRKGE